MARPNRSSYNNVAAFKWCQLKWTISVMFFVFHILVFAYFTRSEINCFSQGTRFEGKNYVGKYEENSNLKDAHANGTPHKINQINNNLKSHIFDKILSEEMLTVVHYHDQEDDSNMPLLQTETKNHLTTPSPVAKHKWPMFENVNSNRKDISKAGAVTEKQMTSKPIIIQESDGFDYTTKNAKISEVIQEAQKLVKGNLLNNKVVGMRSLPGAPLKLTMNDRASPAVKICTCMKTNPSTTGGHSCLGSSNKKRCTHSTPSARSHDCSRVGVTNNCTHTPFPLPPSNPIPYSFYPAFYVPYTYFSTAPKVFPYKVSYPHPYVINDVKLPKKHKHRKTTTSLDDELYYEEKDNQAKVDYDEDYAVTKTKHYPKKERLAFFKTTRDPSVVINIDYDDAEDRNNKFKKLNHHDPHHHAGATMKGAIYDVNQDELVKEIVKDLNNQHNSLVIKDCYCNSSLRTCRINIFVYLFVSLYKFAI